jgi:hypothetical protein
MVPREHLPAMDTLGIGAPWQGEEDARRGEEKAEWTGSAASREASRARGRQRAQEQGGPGVPWLEPGKSSWPAEGGVGRTSSGRGRELGPSSCHGCRDAVHASEEAARLGATHGVKKERNG